MAGDFFNFAIHTQDQSHWCWAATATSVAGYYEGANSSSIFQCDLVNAILPGATSCCADGSSKICNKPWYVASALLYLGHFNQMESGPASRLEDAIAQRRPVVAQITWSDGTNHFTVISGYADIVVSFFPYKMERYLQVYDSFSKESFLPYESFRTAYKGSGKWTATYYTR